jgi:hypothetical protein
LQPLSVPALPRGLSNARKSTQDWWNAWFTSGRASLLDAAGMVVLERLCRLVDDAERTTDPSLRLRLLTEIRRQERHLGIGQLPEPEQQDLGARERERATRGQELREYHVAQRAACAAIGISVDAYETAILEDPFPADAERVRVFLLQQGWEFRKRCDRSESYA